MQSATSKPTVAHGKLGVPDIHWTELQSLWNSATLDSKLDCPAKFMIDMQKNSGNHCNANSTTDGHDTRMDHWRCAVAWAPIDVGWRK